MHITMLTAIKLHMFLSLDPKHYPLECQHLGEIRVPPLTLAYHPPGRFVSLIAGTLLTLAGCTLITRGVDCGGDTERQ